VEPRLPFRDSPRNGQLTFPSIYSHIPCRDCPSGAKSCHLICVQVPHLAGLPETFWEASLQPPPSYQQVRTFFPSLLTLFSLAHFFQFLLLLSIQATNFFSLGSTAAASLPVARTSEPVGRVSQSAGPGAASAPGSVPSVIPSHALAPAATPMEIIPVLLRQRAPMEPSEGSSQGVSPRQAVAMPSGAIASTAPSRTPPSTADPAGTSLGMPHQEPDSAHPELDMHQIARARLDNRAADPDTTMAELEQEYRDRESELLDRSLILRTWPGCTRSASMNFPQPIPGCMTPVQPGGGSRSSSRCGPTTA
jgi:hypothetical protein